MKEKTISIILIIMSVLSAILIIPSKYGNYNIPKLIVLLFSGVLLLVLLLVNYKKLKIDKIDILLLIFGGLVILSTFFSSDIKTSIIGANNRYEGMLMFIIYILTFLCAKKFFKREYLNIFSKIMYGVTLLICILALCQHYLTKIDIPPIFNPNYAYGGASATFGNSNFFGSFISIFLPIYTTAFILNGKKINLLLSGALFSGMIVCIARSSWVATIIYVLSLLIYLFYKRDKKLFKRLIIVVAVFLCVFFIITFDTSKNEKISEKIDIVSYEMKEAVETGVSDRMGSNRIAIWKMVLKLISRNPLLGVGTDNLKNGLYDDVDIRIHELYEFVTINAAMIDKAHNEYLHIAATIGIPASIIYLTFLCIIFFKNLKSAFTDKAKLILLLTMLSYLAQAFFNISTIGVAPFFWLLLGVIDNEEVTKEINKKLDVTV